MFRHVYPIARIDIPFNQDYPTNTFTVVKVLMSQAEAEAENDPLKSSERGQELRLSILHESLG
jgi:hypothetical protein